MDTREFLKDALATHTDRASPVHFAGRGFELDLVLSRATRAQPGTAGGTVVLQGAPGAGKTALLNEIAARFEAQDTRNRAIFLASPWTHSGEGAVLERLAHAAFDVDSEAFDRVETRSESATAGASIGGRDALVPLSLRHLTLQTGSASRIALPAKPLRRQGR